MSSPLDQFKIETKVPLEVGGIDASITNSSLWMFAVVIVLTAFFLVAMRRREMVPGRTQSVAEMLYEFVGNMIRDNVGHGGRPYFPFIFSLFVFILGANYFGMLPYGFTVTSHIAVTFTFAAIVFLGVVVIGFARHGLKFLSMFLPSGTPIYLAPLIIAIELISFLSRPVTLSVRLFANMTAGHILLKVFAGFIISMGAAGGALSALAILPLTMNIALSALEFLVAGVQAYVFALLTCIYLNDAVNLHH
ncbi:MAG: F0F1 ATP synthase subunit A [Sphingomonadales bacterium]